MKGNLLKMKGNLLKMKGNCSLVLVLLGCLVGCLLAWLFACLLSFALLAFFLACLLGSSKLVPWRLLDRSSRCSGTRDAVLGGCLRAPRGVRELETRSLEAAGELLEVFGSSKFGPWSLLESSLRCSGAPHDRLGGFRRASLGVWRFKEWSRRLHEHEMLYLPTFLRLPGGDNPPRLRVGSGGCPRKPRVRVSNVYIFRKKLL